VKVAELLWADESLPVQAPQTAQGRFLVDAHSLAQEPRADVDLTVVAALLERQHEKEGFEGIPVQALKQ